jgi:hypothetical protein
LLVALLGEPDLGEKRVRLGLRIVSPKAFDSDRRLDDVPDDREMRP